MANVVTKPIALDETLQDVVTQLAAINAKTGYSIQTTVTDPGEGSTLATNSLLVVVEE